jgi:hypothetical protein
MSADRYGKGSPFYKGLIFLLTAALVAAIVYPKTVWEGETKNRELCRSRMVNLHNAELQHRSLAGGFTPRLADLAEFVKTDPHYARRVDSLVVLPLRAARKTLDSLRQIQGFADTLIEKLTMAGPDSAMIDSVGRLEDRVIGGSRHVRQVLEAVQERMVALPNMPVSTLDKGLEIIQRKDYFLKMEVVKRMLTAVGNLQLARSSSQAALTNLDNMTIGLEETLAAVAARPAGLDSLCVCPTFHDSLKVTLVDNGALNFIDIRCPIDSLDVQRSQADFFKARLGALKISNHGRIENSERSWELKQ